MANNIPFQPMGNTVVLSATSTSSNTSVTAVSPVNQLMIVNAGANPVFVVISAISSPTAIFPTTGTPQPGFMVGAGATKVVSTNQSSPTATIYVAVIALTGTNAVYVTPGEGM
jgi:hypothetical protein